MIKRPLLSLLVLVPCTVAASTFSGPWGRVPTTRSVSVGGGGGGGYGRSRRSSRSPPATSAAISDAILSPRDSVRSDIPHANEQKGNQLKKVVLAGRARRGKRTKQSGSVEQQADMMESPAMMGDDGQQRFAGPDGEELTLEEMRAQLGPVGKTVAGAVEVGMVTADDLESDRDEYRRNKRRCAR